MFIIPTDSRVTLTVAGPDASAGICTACCQHLAGIMRRFVTERSAGKMPAAAHASPPSTTKQIQAPTSRASAIPTFRIYRARYQDTCRPGKRQIRGTTGQFREGNRVGTAVAKRNLRDERRGRGRGATVWRGSARGIGSSSCQAGSSSVNGAVDR